MADMETALRARIAGGTAARVAWGGQAQGAPLPYITMFTVSDPRPAHLKGYETARTTRVQVDCDAPHFQEALALARAVIASVATPGIYSGHRFGFVKAEGPRALNEEVNGQMVHRQSVDLIIRHVGD